MDVPGMLHGLADEFASLPRGVRSSVCALGGLILTYFAIPLFEDEILMALVYMGLAVVLFWMAIAPFV